MIYLLPEPQDVRPSLASGVTIDAAGEYMDMHGYVYWQGEPSAAKTVSSAGGKISTLFSTVTFANAATNYRIGIQDPDTATGNPLRGDGTYDVQADLQPGTDTITASQARQTAMESGTKSIAHGDYIVIRQELTARGGADSLLLVIADASGTAPVHPGITQNLGAVSGVFGRPICLIEADDGTIGWLCGGTFLNAINTLNFDSASTPDEHCSIFRAPKHNLNVIGIRLFTRFFVANGTVHLILYENPLTSPSAAKTIIRDTDLNTLTSQGWQNHMFSSAYEYRAGATIAAAVQPQDTSSDTLLYQYHTGTTINGRKAPFEGYPNGFEWSHGTRTDATGAFTEDDDAVIHVGLIVSDMSGIVVQNTNVQIFPDRSMVPSGPSWR